MEKILSKHESVLDQFFDETTMSVHFKENVEILRKKGVPGGWESEKIEETPSKNYLNNIINQLYKEIDQNDDSFLEIDRNMSKVLQVGPYRTVIVLPPLSDGIEITVVKPIKKLSIEDYGLDDELLNMLRNQAQGILLSGSPGQGKTTFAQALTEMYVNDNKIIKTIESPRDLLVPDEVTQYSFSYAPHSEVRDILLLSRPDYTVYDEVRNTDDFELFKDLRLTGIGLIGVIHATKPVDSIQRFLGNIEMGVIPQVVDTVIFIKGGKVDKVLNLKHTVKVPEGMESADLARPVIQIYDFFSEDVEFEVYSYGEEVVVMPIKEVEEMQEEKEKSLGGLISYGIKYLQENITNNYKFPIKIKAEGSNSIKLIVPEKNKGSIIGKQGSKINELEKELGLSISVRTFEESPEEESNEIEPELSYEFVKKSKKEIVSIDFGESMKSSDVQVMIGNDILSLTTDKKGKASIKNPEYVKNIKKKGIKIIN